MPQIIVHLSLDLDKEVEDLKIKWKITSKADVIQRLITEGLIREREEKEDPIPAKSNNENKGVEESQVVDNEAPSEKSSVPSYPNLLPSNEEIGGNIIPDPENKPISDNLDGVPNNP